MQFKGQLRRIGRQPPAYQPNIVRAFFRTAEQRVKKVFRALRGKHFRQEFLIQNLIHQISSIRHASCILPPV